MRVIYSIILGVVATTLVFCLFTGTLKAIILVFIVALCHALFLGLPLYLFLPDTLRRKWPTPIIVGFLIGLVPTLLLTFDTSGTQSSQVGGVIHVIDGERTPEGWKHYFRFLGSAALLGIVGALTAWLSWRYFSEIETKEKNI